MLPAPSTFLAGGFNNPASSSLYNPITQNTHFNTYGPQVGAYQQNPLQLPQNQVNKILHFLIK